MENTEEKFLQHEALRYNVRYDGTQCVVSGAFLPMFTYPSYGTFIVSKYETLAQAILRKREQFKPVRTGKEVLCV